MTKSQMPRREGVYNIVSLCLQAYIVQNMSETKPVWKKPNPNKGKSKPLTSAQKAEAKTRAAKAGRRYPNLVDNMAVMKKKKTK